MAHHCVSTISRNCTHAWNVLRVNRWSAMTWVSIINFLDPAYKHLSAYFVDGIGFVQAGKRLVADICDLLFKDEIVSPR